MKRLLITLLVLLNLSALGQTTTTADRVVARQSLYVKDWWVDSVARDTSFSGKTRAVPTADAVYRMVQGRTLAGGTLTLSDTLASTKETFSGSTATTRTLGQTPYATYNLQVFLNGVLLPTADYSVSGQTLTLNFTPEASDVITVFYPVLGGGASAWADLTGKPTTLSGYGITDGDTVRVATTAPTTTNFYFLPTDTSLNVYHAGVWFKFRANAVAAGPTTLSTPGSFSATAASSSQINLTWSDVSGEASYELQRGSVSDYSDAVTIHSPAAGSTSYNNTGLAASTTYYYRLRAVGDGTAYATSAWATTSATTQSAADVTPPALTAATVELAAMDQVVLTYSEALNTTITPQAAWYAVRLGGSNTAVLSVAYSGSTQLILTLAAAAQKGQTIEMDYTSAAGRLQDAAGNLAASLSAQAVQNNIPSDLAHLWLAESGVTNAGGFASAWADGIANLSWTQNTVGAQPAIDAADADYGNTLVFDGANDNTTAHTAVGQGTAVTICATVKGWNAGTIISNRWNYAGGGNWWTLKGTSLELGNPSETLSFGTVPTKAVLIVVISSSGAKAYVNGVEVATSSSAFNIASGTDDMLLGGIFDGNGLAQVGGGEVAELRLYNSAKTPTEVAAISEQMRIRNNVY
jgi:hypothetical protein